MRCPAHTTTSADFSLRQSRRPFRHKARSPQVRTHTFIAQPPHLRRLALVTRASWYPAHSPCLAAPSMQFLFIGSRFTLHASFPHSVTLMQLRFTLLTVTSSQRDLHPQVCAHAGRTGETPAADKRRGWVHPKLGKAQGNSAARTKTCTKQARECDLQTRLPKNVTWIGVNPESEIGTQDWVTDSG